MAAKIGSRNNLDDAFNKLNNVRDLSSQSQLLSFPPFPPTTTSNGERGTTYRCHCARSFKTFLMVFNLPFATTTTSSSLKTSSIVASVSRASLAITSSSRWRRRKGQRLRRARDN